MLHFSSLRYTQDPMLFAFHSGSIALLVMHELEAPHIHLSNDEAIRALKHAIAQVHEQTVPSVRSLS
jgi:predicted aminopeptidase